MASKYFRNQLAKSDPANRRFIQKNLDIVEQVVAILNEKEMSQRDLAQKLGKAEAEVSRMLSGLHNLTVKTLARLEVALGEDIIITPKNAQEQGLGVKSGKVVSFQSQNMRKAVGSGVHMNYRIQNRQSNGMNAYEREAQKVKPINQVVDFKRSKEKDTKS